MQREVWRIRSFQQQKNKRIYLFIFIECTRAVSQSSFSLSVFV